MRRIAFFFITVLMILSCQSAWAKSNPSSLPLTPGKTLPELAFDPEWRGEVESPFIAKENGFELRVTIGPGQRIDFPTILDNQTPIIIHTRYGTVRQFLVAEEVYEGELAGRYLVYRGPDRSILYRYDSDKKELREFVYLANGTSLKKTGQVSLWRFEGAELSPREDGSVALMKKSDPVGEVKNIAGQDMAARISRFLAKRRKESLQDKPIEKTLFIIPAPDYVDGRHATRKEGIRYEVEDHQLKLVLDVEKDLLFPLWVDPTLTGDSDADVIINGQGQDDQFGYSVASAGDFNGDGRKDVIVGSIDAKAYIFFGFQGQVQTSQGSQNVQSTLTADADADVILNGQGGTYGYSVASAGDFNGDGRDDVIVGASTAQGNESSSGRAYIYFGFQGQGQTSLFEFQGQPQNSGDPTPPPVSDADVILNGQNTNDHFGHSVASAGDFNGDGKDDVIVGAEFDNNNGSQSGSAFIFFGQAQSSQTILTADADADVILNGHDVNNIFGFSVASAGDFNGDGKDDVIVGAYADDNSGVCVNTFCNSGSAFIFFGQAQPSLTSPINADDADVILNGQNVDDFLGYSVASAGDFNQDGKDDVIVGAPQSNKNALTGKAFIFFGFQGQAQNSQTILTADSDADLILNGQSADDEFGTSVSGAGDFNGDGKDDVIVGNPKDDNGTAFIFLGGQIGTINDPDTNANLVILGQSGGDALGYSVASAGDFNGDGKSDVIVGAFGDDNNGNFSGSAFIFSSSDEVPKIALGLGPGGNGYMQIIKGLPPYDHLAWPRVEWSSYNSTYGESRPVLCDVDGDGKNELVIGLGNGGEGWLEVKDDLDSGLTHLAWLQVPWSAYNSANGETFPSCSDPDKDGKDELVIGLGDGGDGWFLVWDDATTGYANMPNSDNGWVRLNWGAYNSSSGKTMPNVQ